MLESDGVFHETDAGVYVRSCLGMEAMVCIASEGGSAHTFYSCKVKFANVIAPDRLKQTVQHSLVRLRHLAPSLACRILRSPSNVYEFEYRVPKTLDDALDWTKDIVFMAESGRDFEENHCRIAPEGWWKASAGRYTSELHVAPNSSEGNTSWTFTLSLHHGNADGRVSWMIFDKLFEYLSDEINGTSPPLSTYEWGKEVCRLAPAGPIVWSLADVGKLERTPTAEPPMNSQASLNIVPFTYQARVTDEKPSQTDFFSCLKLSRDETTKLHTACKAHGRTITQVTSALFTLADVQSALAIAGWVGAQRFKEVLDGFENATHFVTSLNAVSMRPHMPAAYQAFGTESCTPFTAGDAVPLTLPFEPFRKLTTVDQETCSVVRKIDLTTFWDKLVPAAADAWKAEDKSVDAYIKRSAAMNAMASTISTENTGTQSSDDSASVAPCSSSFGDLTRLGILESFRPSSGNKTLVVEDIDYSPRSTLAAILTVTFQYDGQFHMKSFKGARYSTQGELDLVAEIFKEWLDAIVQS